MQKVIADDRVFVREASGMDQEFTQVRLFELIAQMEAMLPDLDAAGEQLAAIHLLNAIDALRALDAGKSD